MIYEQRVGSLAALPDLELYANYRQESWQTLDGEDRLALLRETVRREAARTGHDYEANVRLEDLPPELAGYEANGSIVLDREMVVSDRMSHRYGGREIIFDLPDGGYRALETVLHEYRHVVQEDIISGRLAADESFRMRLASNDVTTSYVDQKIVSQYLTGKTSYALYYLQPVELDAYRTSQERTAEILGDIQLQYGADQAMDVFRQRMAEEGWQARTVAYNAQYRVEDAAEEVAKALYNVYANQSSGADPAVEQAVRAEMLASAQQKTGIAAASGITM